MTATARRTVRACAFSLLIALAALCVRSGNIPYSNSPEPAHSRPGFQPVSLELDTAGAGELLQQLPLRFEPSGDAAFEYIARGPGYWLGLTKSEIVVVGRNFRQEEVLPLRIRLEGASGETVLNGTRRLDGVSNYYAGNDPSQWRIAAPQFGAVEYSGLYPGVDAVFYGTPRELEFDFVVAPGADPGLIQLHFSGAAVKLDGHGDLVAVLSGQEVRLQRPVIYQTVTGSHVRIEGEFILRGNTVAFQIGTYDRSLPLVIDPILLYASYLGGAAADAINAVAVDASGNVVIAGATQSTNFPLQDPAQGSNRGGPDAFISKLTPTGHALLYSTYFGGAGSEEFTAIAIDSTGSAWAVGFTNSANFPLLSPLQGQGSINPGFDATVSRFSPGGILQFSTFFGGNADEAARAIALDATSAYIVGDTFSTNLPIGISAQPNFGGGVPASCPALITGQAMGGDAFVLKLSAAGSFLQYATYLGGSGCEAGRSVAVDSAGNAYVTGATNSANFPTLTPLQATLGGGTCAPFGGGASTPCPDAFVAKVNSGGSALLYSTYLGGNNLDDGAAIAVDADSNVYLTGDTQSPNFPIAAAHDSSLSGNTDAFVSKLNTAGSALILSTFLGGSGADHGRALKLDSARRIFLAGYTNSGDFPKASELKSALAGGFDLFAATFRASGASLDFSSFYGGPGDEQGRGLALDASGNLWVAGSTQSNAFPVLAALQQASAGAMDGVLLKTGPVAVGGVPVINAGGIVNNASFAQGSVAPGSIAAIFGSNLTNGASLLSSSIGPDGKLVNVLGGTSATVNDTFAPMFYATPGQIGVQIPFEVAGLSSVFVRVFVDGQASLPVLVPIASFAPGLFTTNQEGTGAAAALHQDGVAPVTSDNPARLNEVIVFFATGLGVTSPALATGAPSGGNTTTVTAATATVGGIPATVTFSGTAPGFVGLNQVNIRIPAGVAPGGAVPVVLNIGGQQSGTVFLPVAP